MKTISKKIFIATAALLALQGAAFAQSSAGWYVGGSVGKAEVKPDVSGILTASTVEDKSSTGYKIFAGYQLDSTWAIEAQYQSLGKYTYTDPGLEAFRLKDSGLSVAAVGQLPLAKDFALIGKAGVAVHRFKGDYAGYGVTESESKTKASLLLGFGAEYSLSSNLALRAEYEYFGQPKLDDTKVKTSLFSVGLRYKF